MTTPGTPRAFRPDDAAAVLQLAAASYTVDSRWHVGDLAWHLADTGGRGLGDQTFVWECDEDAASDGLLAVSWWDRIEVGGEQRVVLTFIGPTDLLPRIVDHAVTVLEPSVVAMDVVVLAVERDQEAVLARLGFVTDEHPEFFVNLQRGLASLASEPTPEPPQGIRVTRADEHSPQAWVDLHRAVWPESTLTVADRTSLTQTWPYDPRFDLVAVRDDGLLVGYVVGWLPPGASTGQFEPVGTLPGWRRRGISRVLGHRVLTAFADAGASRALVYARGDDDYPAARAAYEAMGFTVHARQNRWQRRLG